MSDFSKSLIDKVSGKVLAFDPRPAPTRSAVLTVLLEPDKYERVVELAADWGITTNQAAARLIDCYIEAERDA